METVIEQTEEFVFQRPGLYPKQLAAFYTPARYSLIEANTKAGKSVSGMTWLLEQALGGKKGENFWWVAPVFPQAKIIYSRLLAALGPEFRDKSDTELWIHLFNGTKIWFKSGEKPDNLYGEDVYAVVIDEASRLREESWHAIRSTLTFTRGKVRMIGNVKGRKNWFYKLCRKAESGEPDHAHFKITWRDGVDAGVLDMAEIEDARRVLPANVFKELYEAEASDDEGNPFGIAAIRACIIPELSANPVSCWGWDLAKSHDWTVGVALDAGAKMVHFERFQKLPWPDTEKRIILGTKGKPALCDSTGVGDPVVEHLQAAGGNFEGYLFTSRSKQQLMEGLAVAIQQKRIGLTDGAVISELESFEYTYSRTGCAYSAPEGMHDDAVCALALAVHHLAFSAAPFRFQRIPNRVNTPDPEPVMGGPEYGLYKKPGGWENQSGLI